MSDRKHVAIIGGGAAGFFAAIQSKERHPADTVTIFEKSGRVLAKVSVSGGGRCNLTNSFLGINDLKSVYPRGDKLMKRLFNSFDNNDACQWFEQHGVELTTQDDQCVFPRSQSSQTVIDCLTRTAAKAGVTVCLRHQLVKVAPRPDGRLEVDFKDRPSRTSDKVVLTTGGSPRMAGLAYASGDGTQD